jgi:hypothetical protein
MLATSITVTELDNARRVRLSDDDIIYTAFVTYVEAPTRDDAITFAKARFGFRG